MRTTIFADFANFLFHMKIVSPKYNIYVIIHCDTEVLHEFTSKNNFHKIVLLSFLQNLYPLKKVPYGIIVDFNVLLGPAK